MADPHNPGANIIGGVYALSAARRVLCWGGGAGGGKNFARLADLGWIGGRDAVEIGLDEADQLLGESDAFPPFLARRSVAVAWPPSHGSMQGADIASFSAAHRIITSLPVAAIGRPGGVPPHRPAFVWSHPRRARQSQPSAARSDPAGSAGTHLAALRGREAAKFFRDHMGSGARGMSRPTISGRKGPNGWRCGVGQGAMAAVLAQGGNAVARLGGGFGHVNRA